MNANQTSGSEEATLIEKRLRLPVYFLVALGIYSTLIYVINWTRYPPLYTVFIFASFAIDAAIAWGIFRRKPWGRILGIILFVLYVYSSLNNIYGSLTGSTLVSRFYVIIDIIICITSLLSTVVLVKSATAFLVEKPHVSSFTAPGQRVKPPRPLPSWLDPTLVSATAATLTYIIVGTCPGMVIFSFLSESYCPSVVVDPAGARGLVVFWMIPFPVIFLLGGLLGFFVNRYMLAHRESISQRSIAILSGVLVGMVSTFIGIWILQMVFCSA